MGITLEGRTYIPLAGSPDEPSEARPPPGRAGRTGVLRVKVFGDGSRATAAITILVKNPADPGRPTVHYVDDYLSAKQTLDKVAAVG